MSTALQNNTSKTRNVTSLLSISQVADQLGMCDAWVRGRVRSGDIPAFRVSGDKYSIWRVRQEDLNNWVTAQSVSVGA
jgi:excisionase family DNA binding protein